MLNGWKAIATYLRRDERTAMRWAAERGMPVHRAPGPGRGSVYALADEIDDWLAAARERVVEARVPATVVIEPDGPAIVTLARLPWWRSRPTVGWALTSLGILLVALGAAMLHRPAVGEVSRDPAYADPVARSLYLQASYDWNRRTSASLRRATLEYSEAIGRDPRVPAGYVGLANSYLLLREYGAMPEPEAYSRAEAAARAAAALSPMSVEAQRTVAFIDFWWRQDRPAARRAFARALALRPDDPLTHHWYANALLANGEAHPALREIERAREIDPSDGSILADRAMILYLAGRRREALSTLRVLARDQPDMLRPHRALAEFALVEARGDEFLAESATAATLRGDAAGLAAVARWRIAGPGAAAIDAAMLRDAEGAAGRGGSWFRVAQLAALAGHGAQAREALARACAIHEPATVSAPSDLLLAHALNRADIVERCGWVSMLS